MTTVVMTDYARRPKRIWQADGLFDMAIGIACLGIAFVNADGIYMVGIAGGPHITYTRISRIDMFVTAPVQLLVPLSFGLIEPLKRRFVYPRTGYVLLRSNPLSERVLFGLILAAALVMFAIGARWLLGPALSSRLSFWTPEMTQIGTGLGVTSVLVFNFLNFRFVRHLIVAIMVFAVTILRLTTHLDWMDGEILLWGTIGASLLVAGASAFVPLMRTPRLLEQEDQ